MATKKFRDLTPVELAAIRAYATEHGRYWKEDLSNDWYNAAQPGVLQQIRNTLGPAWLRQYTLPKVERVPAPQTLPFRYLFDDQSGGYNLYGLPSLPENATILIPTTDTDRGNRKRLKWSGTSQPPAIGTRVYVEANGQGAGTVQGYFIEYNWLGLHVTLDVMPKWLLDRRKDEPDEFYPDHVFVFGCDLDDHTKV